MNCRCVVNRPLCSFIIALNRPDFVERNMEFLYRWLKVQQFTVKVINGYLKDDFLGSFPFSLQTIYARI